MIVNKKILFISVFILYSYLCFSQTEIKGIKPCVDSLIYNLNNSTKYKDINIRIIEEGVVFYDTYFVDTVKNDNISSLIEYIDIDIFIQSFIYIQILAVLAYYKLLIVTRHSDDYHD